MPKACRTTGRLFRIGHKQKLRGLILTHPFLLVREIWTSVKEAGRSGWATATTPRASGTSPSSIRNDQLTDDQHAALTMIAGSPRGVTEPLLVDVHGFAVELLVGLVRATLASVAPETMRSGGRVVEVTRLRITDAGRRALATNAEALIDGRNPRRDTSSWIGT
jgi:hypothetical protein